MFAPITREPWAQNAEFNFKLEQFTSVRARDVPLFIARCGVLRGFVSDP
jgi:hypothetical protein